MADEVEEAEEVFFFTDEATNTIVWATQKEWDARQSNG